MNILLLISAIILTIFCCSCLIFAQQPYEGQAFSDCHNPETYSKSVLGYTCNGASKSCQSFLTFRSRAPYNTVSAISSMLASDPSQLVEINSVSETATFETNKLVIVPINCSCSVIASESFEALEKSQEKNVEEEGSRDFLEALSGIAQSLKVYKFEELQRATS